MRNNRQIAVTERYDRVLGDGNQSSEGLKLFDETGHFVKGVDIFLNGVSGGEGIRKMDDSSVMVIGYSAPDGIPEFTFTLVSDDLNIIWSKSIKTYTNYEFSPSGLIYDDLIKDEEGNYYFVTNSTKFFETKSRILVYKMDKSGNQVWLKAYEMNKGTFGLASATTTKTSLIIILEGSFDEGSGSVRIDKNTGEMVNSFLYQN